MSLEGSLSTDVETSAKIVERRTTRAGRSPGVRKCVREGSTFPSGELYARLHLIVNKIAFANQCVERSLQERS